MHGNVTNCVCRITVSGVTNANSAMRHSGMYGTGKYRDATWAESFAAPQCSVRYGCLGEFFTHDAQQRAERSATLTPGDTRQSEQWMHTLRQRQVIQGMARSDEDRGHCNWSVFVSSIATRSES